MSNRIVRPKSAEELRLEQTERRKESWREIWSYVLIAIMAAMILGSIYIQILHHP